MTTTTARVVVDETNPPAPLDLDPIVARHAAAIPGPYRWWGNTDSGNVALAGYVPGQGICEVVSTIKEDHTSKDTRQINEIARYVEDYSSLSEFLLGHDEWPDEWDTAAGVKASAFEYSDERQSNNRLRETWIYDTDNGDRRPEVTAALHRAATKEWIGEDEYGQPRSTTKLALTTAKHFRKTVDEQAVYEVARNQGLPDDTPRDHDKVYRADICDVRNPNGQFLAASWQDVADLLTEVQRLHGRLDRHKAALNVALHHASLPMTGRTETDLDELDGCRMVLADEDAGITTTRTAPTTEGAPA